MSLIRLGLCQRPGGVEREVSKHHDRRVEEHGADGRHGFVFWRLGETRLMRSCY